MTHQIQPANDLLPHNTEAEQQLLGAILTDNGIYDRVADILRVEHFFDPVHQRIYDIAGRRIREGMTASPVTMKTFLDGDAGLSALGGPAYLVRLAGGSIGAHSSRDFARIVIDAAARRLMIEASDRAIDHLRHGEDLGRVQADLTHALMTLPEASGLESSVSLLRAMTEAISRINESYQGNVSFLKTGLPALDYQLRGLGSDNLMLIGGATSMGKTSLALEIASRCAIDQGCRVGFWSLEMSQEQLAERMLAARARVPYAALRDASELPEADFRKIVAAAKENEKAPLRIIPKHIRDVSGGEAAFRRVRREFGGLDLAVVDYAQLIRAPGSSRYEKMTEVSIRLKGLSGILGCPVIGLVQLDRSIGEREDPRPQLSDIKESGQFENDADQVVMCYRAEYYLERRGPKLSKGGEVTAEARADFEAAISKARNKMELLVRKNRHGPIGAVEVGFHAPTNRFWRLNDDQMGMFDE